MRLKKLFKAAFIVGIAHGGRGVQAQEGAKSESRVQGRRSGSLIRLGFDYRRNSDILDDRLTGATPLIPDGSSRFSITQMKLSGLMTIAGGRESALMIGGAVPFRNLETTAPDKESGSELGGFEMDFRLRFMRRLEAKVAYARRQSPKLFLHDNHSELAGTFSIEHREHFLGRLSLLLRAAPELIFASGSDVKGLAIGYGPQVGLGGEATLDLFFSNAAHFRFGSEVFYRRIGSYRVEGTDQGGASLLSLTPAFDYRILDEMWVGIFAEIPLQNASNRERSFGNSELPGLYGKSFGLRLRAASL